VAVKLDSEIMMVYNRAMQNTMSPYKGLVYYLKAVPAIGEPEASFQYEIMWISEIIDNDNVTEEHIKAQSPPDCVGATFAYFTAN